MLIATHPLAKCASLSLCRYNWKSTEWSDCRVDVLLSQQDRRRSNQTGLCGGGVQTREVYCVQAPTETSSNLSSLKIKDGKKTFLRNILNDQIKTSIGIGNKQTYLNVIGLFKNSFKFD